MIPLDTPGSTPLWYLYMDEEKVIRVKLHGIIDPGKEYASASVEVPRSETIGQFPVHQRPLRCFFLTEFDATLSLMEALLDKDLELTEERRRLQAAIGVASKRAVDLKQGAPERT